MEFPAVTICGSGLSDNTLEAAFYKIFLDFLDANNAKIAITPYAAGQFLQEYQAVIVFFFHFTWLFHFSRFLNNAD